MTRSSEPRSGSQIPAMSDGVKFSMGKRTQTRNNAINVSNDSYTYTLEIKSGSMSTVMPNKYIYASLH